MHVKVHAQWESNTACQQHLHDDVIWPQRPECFEASYCILYFFPFMKIRSCLTQIYITKFVTKCILVFVVKKTWPCRCLHSNTWDCEVLSEQDESSDWYLHCLIALLICIVRVTIKWPVMWMLHLHPSAHRKRMTKTLSSAAFSTAVGTEYRTIPTKRRKLFVRTS